MKKKVVILSGSGISAESGIPTFRDMGGLWKQYRFEEVASPDAWYSNPQVVMDFYNERRKKSLEVKPNEGHLSLVRLEEKYDVQIITQNVDNLHERAGSKNVLHLHGELHKSRSTKDPSLVYDIDGWELKLGDKCEKGSQLRPHIVWFGEPVPMINKASMICQKADIFIVVGTSLAVYPAAGLIDYVPSKTDKYIVDISQVAMNSNIKNLYFINKKASEGLPELVDKLLKE